MDNVKTFFDSIKEFIWDIIGYFLPGSYVLILLSICINSSYFINHSIETDSNNQNFLIFFIISYIVGYVVYGLGILKEDRLGKKSYTKIIEKQVQERQAFKLSKEFISNDLKNKGSKQSIDSATVRDIRSIAMSFIPEQDQKIYTFTFRYEICNNVGNVSFLIGSLGIISFCVSLLFKIYIFNVDMQYIFLYTILILSYYPLTKARNKFYAISISLPFSIFTAKFLSK